MKNFLLVPALFFAFPVYAASFVLAPSATEVRVGQEVSIVVLVDAGEERIVTAKTVLAFPADVFDLVSFGHAPEWMALTASGYDAVGGGSVVKTAGSPGGFTGIREFGTLVLRARTAGSGGVAVSVPDSLLLNAQGVNKLSDARGAAISVSAPSLVPAPVPVAEPVPALIGSPEFVTEPIDGLLPEAEATTGAEAAVAQSGLGALSLPWRIVLFVLVVGIIAGVAWYTWRK